jgi:molybdate transport system substrate-binding protein
LICIPSRLFSSPKTKDIVMFRLFFVLAIVCCSVQAAHADLTLYAAGSLKSALTELVGAYTHQSGIAVKTEFGPSGLLRERIEKGEAVDVFASADMNHPRKLVAAGKASFVVRFTGNSLCALTKPELGLNPEKLLQAMLNPSIKLGTSTPLSDPAGDYTWKLFDKADSLSPGAGKVLRDKALQLVGGPGSEAIPAGRSAVPYLMASGKADIFLAYCTTGPAAGLEAARLVTVRLPAELAQSADYGLVVLNASPAAAQFALFILSEPAQAILAKWGFEVAGAH